MPLLKPTRHQLVRNVAMLEGTTIAEGKGQKDEFWLEGNDIESVSQSAASLHGACLVRNKDIRKFLDGESITHRGKINFMAYCFLNAQVSTSARRPTSSLRNKHLQALYHGPCTSTLSILFSPMRQCSGTSGKTLLTLLMF